MGKARSRETLNQGKVYVAVAVLTGAKVQRRRDSLFSTPKRNNSAPKTEKKKKKKQKKKKPKQPQNKKKFYASQKGEGKDNQGTCRRSEDVTILGEKH